MIFSKSLALKKPSILSNLTVVGREIRRGISILFQSRAYPVIPEHLYFPSSDSGDRFAGNEKERAENTVKSMNPGLYICSQK